MTWTPSAGLHPLRAVRTFTLPREGGSGYRLVTVRTDTYSCATCTYASAPEDRGVPVTVWRVTNPPTPWWITPEVHCCAAGHTELQVRAAPAQVRPARRWPPLLRP